MLKMIPRKMGESRSYSAHGQTFIVKRSHSRNTWTLRMEGLERVRFGDFRQISEDIGHTLECGVLPPRSKWSPY